MNDTIVIGEILKAQGIKGELKIRPLTHDLGRFSKLKAVIIGNTPYRIKGIRIDGKNVFMCLYGIEDRTLAESLRGKMIEVERIFAVDLDEDEFFIADLEGCTVYDDQGSNLGRVKAVLQYGAADVFSLSGIKNVMFPFLKKAIKKIDVESKTIIVFREEFDRVAVYED